MPPISGNISSDKICETTSHKFETDPEILVSKLSFSHIREIMSIDDSFERFFYELECIKGAWSVRELRRQITTNLYVRAGISKKPELLIDQIKNDEYSTELSIKEPFAFEFLGLDAKDAVTEPELEKALILGWSQSITQANLPVNINPRTVSRKIWNQK